MIELESVSFTYPNANFEIEVPTLQITKGETVALIGPSGSGKTTLINLMAGLILPNSGKIQVEKLSLEQLSNADRQDLRIVKMGLIFQEFELLDYLSVEENILLPFRINSVLEWSDSNRQQAQELANRVGLGDKLNKHPRNLSQGERQRVAIARALITSPELLLCDEPTANLDPKNRDLILDILFGYVKETQTTLVMVTHDHEILSRFERLIDMNSLTK